jgi:branched-chain amino acid transport system permease protein
MGLSLMTMIKNKRTTAMPMIVSKNNVNHFMAFMLATVALVFYLIGTVIGEVFYFRLACEALIFSGLAMSVDILLGYTGLLSLGQALFFGLGAYTSTLLLRDWQTGFWLAIIGSLVITAPISLLCGLIAIRARGVYFVLITFGLAQVVAKSVYNIQGLGASDGLTGVPIITANFLLFQVNLGHAPSIFLLLMVVTLCTYFVLDYLMHLPFGRLLHAVRSNESRVPFLGFNSQIYKMLAYVLAAEVATLFGAFYPMLRGFVSPELFFFDTSTNAVIACIIGGVGSLIGPVFGSLVFTTIKSFVSSYTEYHVLVIGILFMLSVVFFPKGIAGYFKRRFDHFHKKRANS